MTSDEKQKICEYFSIYNYRIRRLDGYSNFYKDINEGIGRTIL